MRAFYHKSLGWRCHTGYKRSDVILEIAYKFFADNQAARKLSDLHMMSALHKSRRIGKPEGQSTMLIHN
jgi:hypothetical protein